MDLTRGFLRSGQTLEEVRWVCEEHLRDLGADSFWYWGIGAFIFAGEETVVSVSGRDYVTSEYVLGGEELLTLDLSPQRDGVWGDFARTLVMEDCHALDDAREARNPHWRAGVLTEYELHSLLIDVASPAMTFEDLARTMNQHITKSGYENLDFLGNLGHSIADRSDDRIYIEAGNTTKLGDVELFTFEPHIRQLAGSFGYKHENIYRFVGGRLASI